MPWNSKMHWHMRFCVFDREVNSALKSYQKHKHWKCTLAITQTHIISGWVRLIQCVLYSFIVLVQFIGAYIRKKDIIYKQSICKGLVAVRNVTVLFYISRILNNNDCLLLFFKISNYYLLPEGLFWANRNLWYVYMNNKTCDVPYLYKDSQSYSNPALEILELSLNSFKHKIFWAKFSDNSTN